MEKVKEINIILSFEIFVFIGCFEHIAKMSTDEEYLFSWKNYEQNFPQRFFEFLEKREFVDVTLIVEGHLIGVHRLILSAISPYFHAMFTESNQPCGKCSGVFFSKEKNDLNDAK